MLDNRPSENDEALSKLLSTWKPEAQLPPRFQESVWHRIACAETEPAPGCFKAIAVWIETAFSRPALAISYVALLLLTGVGAGYWHGEGRVTHAQSEWRSRYVQAVDPYQMPRN